MFWFGVLNPKILAYASMTKRSTVIPAEAGTSISTLAFIRDNKVQRRTKRI